MTFTTRILSIWAFLGISAAYAQTSPTIYCKSGNHTLAAPDYAQPASNEIVDGAYYRVIHFVSLPDHEEQNRLAANGLELLQYLPQNAYFCRIATQCNVQTLVGNAVDGLSPVQSVFKLSSDLAHKNYPHWALFGDTQIELNALFYTGIDPLSAQQALQSQGAEILGIHAGKYIEFRVALNALEQIYQLPHFFYFECVSPPEEPENLDGRTNHRSNMLFTDYASGLQYDGSGVTVMMQDDGYIGDHIDYEGRIDQSNCWGCNWDDINNHGDHVAGTIMGAGNLNPRYRGMASGAHLLVFNSSNSNYDDVPQLYNTEQMVITSKSYSSNCNGGYDALTSQLDEQSFDMPELIHIFSAGNNGTVDCGYGAGAGWGNITGGHKSGKNVVAVGNLNTLDVLAGSSSRGPATDGRIKPDFCAVGTGVVSTVSDYLYEAKTGTSMACPGVAGTVAQLYQAYRDMNGGANPQGGLIKATLMNTAEDLGNPGPDFKYGWGRINAIKAYDLLDQGNYISAIVGQGGSNAHSLSIPAGVTRAKIMVYWTDVEGAPNASTALVNNLNMTVSDPAMVNFQPWVLDPTPNAANLDANAVTGTDNLNNMEQVEIVNPLAGTYTVTINGTSVPQGPQEYFLVYQFETDQVRLTYPVGGEGLAPGTSERVRWDADQGVDDFILEYTLDNGGSWVQFQTALATERSATWQVPSTLTGEARVRVSRGAQSDESDANFSIIQIPDNLEVQWACPDSLRLTWDAVSGASSYEVYMLGPMYMDPVGTTTSTALTVMASAQDENWFSIRSFGPNGARSERAIAIRKQPGEFGCIWSSPYAGISVECDSTSVLSCVQVNDASINAGLGTTYLWYFPGGTPATSTDQNPVVCYSSSGFQDAALVVDNGAGTDSSYFSNYVFVQTALPLPYLESFENMLSFTGQENWTVYNSSSGSSFTITTAAALTGTKSAKLNNYTQDVGDFDELISGPIDLSTLNPSSDIMTLSFRYAHRKRDNASDDWLRLYTTSSCDGMWSLKKTLHGNFLSTATSTSSWTPQSAQDWVTVHVTNITSQYFTNDFRFKFYFENGGGNNLYLEDINIYSGAPSDDLVTSGLGELSGTLESTLFPNPADEEVNLRFGLQADAPVQIEICDVGGRVLQRTHLQGKSGANLVSLDTEALDGGMYFLQIQSANQRATHAFVLK